MLMRNTHTNPAVKTHAPTERNVLVHLIGTVIIQAQPRNDTNFGTRHIDRIGLSLCEALRVVTTYTHQEREKDWKTASKQARGRASDMECWRDSETL